MSKTLWVVGGVVAVGVGVGYVYRRRAVAARAVLDERAHQETQARQDEQALRDARVTSVTATVASARGDKTPMRVGDVVAVTAVATGTTAPVEFRTVVTRPDDRTTVACDWSPNPTCQVTLDAAGAWLVHAEARPMGSTAPPAATAKARLAVMPAAPVDRAVATPLQSAVPSTPMGTFFPVTTLPPITSQEQRYVHV